MKKEIRVVNEKEKMIQITTPDERWYVKEGSDKKTKLPIFEYVPSITWICGYYPKGIQFYKWLAEKGWDESQAIKETAGTRGTKVHKAIEDLVNGLEVKIDSKYENKNTGEFEEITVDEYDAIISFANWYNLVKPEVVANEFVVWNAKYNFAGTVDLVCKINGEWWIIDIKTSKSIWEEYKLQISAYKNTVLQNGIEGIEKDDQPTQIKTAILQVGYNRNKTGYKFTEIEDKFDMFLVAQQIWNNENKDVKPQQKDYPMSVKLETQVEENLEEITEEENAKLKTTA
ncbi:MAG: hypothetical protein RLZZ546_2159 [Bacteroidota bacterium]